MIHKVTLKNFKKIENQTFDLTDFDLLVGSNNSGKSTLLQALAIWQYCVDQFKRAKKSGSSRGIQIVLPEFTALPLPEFILLWTNRLERRNIRQKSGKTKPEYILIEIQVFWSEFEEGRKQDEELCIQLRYQSPQSIYAIPVGGWDHFRKISIKESFPQIVYVPPFSGLEPIEQWIDDGNVRQNVGKGQPGSVLRNLLYRVIDQKTENGERIPYNRNLNWIEISSKVEEWFGIKINLPEYEMGQGTRINLSYFVGKKEFDIISGGSGFHQILTLLAFFYGYNDVTTILFDEPDAHLHVNLQKQILNYFKQKNKIQFLIATHSEEFIRGVEVNSIISMLSDAPKRISATETIVRAMSEVDNIVVVKTKLSPYILYVEGEDDERLLTSWASKTNHQDILRKFHIFKMGGTTKDDMKRLSDKHFSALTQINPEVKRVVLFDRDDDKSFHPDENNPVIKEWKRRNIENYLLVREAWEMSILDATNRPEFDLFNQEYQVTINSFFDEQGLILPKNFSWRNVKANIFEIVDGKKILFENDESLFHRLREFEDLKINRERVANNMTPDMIHEDIYNFFEFLKKVINDN
jgi:predicted ATPase